MNDTPDIEADYKAIRVLCIALALVPVLLAVPAFLTIAGVW